MTRRRDLHCRWRRKIGRRSVGTVRSDGPLAALPPGMPLTLQFTPASVLFFTVAVKTIVFPGGTELLEALTVTVIDGGGGGGGGPTEPAPPPPQPRVQAPAVRSTNKGETLFATCKGSLP
jgi:hypothetical protein